MNSTYFIAFRTMNTIQFLSHRLCEFGTFTIIFILNAAFILHSNMAAAAKPNVRNLSEETRIADASRNTLEWQRLQVTQKDLREASAFLENTAYLFAEGKSYTPDEMYRGLENASKTHLGIESKTDFLEIIRTVKALSQVALSQPMNGTGSLSAENVVIPGNDYRSVSFVEQNNDSTRSRLRQLTATIEFLAQYSENINESLPQEDVAKKRNILDKYDTVEKILFWKSPKAADRPLVLGIIRLLPYYKLVTLLLPMIYAPASQWDWLGNAIAAYIAKVIIDDSIFKSLFLATKAAHLARVDRGMKDLQVKQAFALALRDYFLHSPSITQSDELNRTVQQLLKGEIPKDIQPVLCDLMLGGSGPNGGSSSDGPRTGVRYEGGAQDSATAGSETQGLDEITRRSPPVIGKK